MGGGGSKASGGGGSGSSSSRSEYGGRCITRIIEPSRKDSSKTVVKDSHSYPSAHSNSRSGEGSKSTGSKKEESKASGLSYGGNIEYSGGYSSVVLSSIPPRESYISNPYAPQYIKSFESYLLQKYGGLTALTKGVILGSNSVYGRFQLDTLVKLPSESLAMKDMVHTLTCMSLSVQGREETIPSVVKVITLCDNNICDYDLLKLQTSCFAYRSKLNLDGLYLHHNQITDVGVKYLLNAYVPDSGLKIPPLILDRIVKENIKGFINAPGYRSVIELNLSCNQIGDDGAKLLADSLVKGEMPKLKVLRLEDNKITDKGISYFAKALQRGVQDIIVLLNRLDKHSKMFLGDRQEKLAEMNRILKIAEENGVNTKTIVMEKSLKSQIINNVTISITGGWGFTKCYFIPSNITDYVGDYMKGKLVTKISKRLEKYITMESIVNCYLEASDEAWSSPSGIEIINKEREAMGVSDEGFIE